MKSVTKIILIGMCHIIYFFGFYALVQHGLSTVYERTPGLIIDLIWVVLPTVIAGKLYYSCMIKTTWLSSYSKRKMIIIMCAIVMALFSLSIGATWAFNTYGT